MATDTLVPQLVINHLTQAQYNEALANGQISETELYCVPSEETVVTSVNGQIGEVIIHNATSSTSGLLSAADKSKLDGIAESADKTTIYTAAECTTFTSDEGACTPAAVKKATTQFAVPKVASTDKAITRFNGTTGDVQNSKILIEDVTNSRDTSKKAQVLSIPAEGGKKMVFGYCTDQVDGTSFLGGLFSTSATSFPYSEGLAIGGSSGNLLWKGAKVATVNDIPATYTHPAYTARTGVPTANQTPAFGGTFTVTQPVSDASGHITAMNSRTVTIPSSTATTSSNGLMSSSDKSKLDGLTTETWTFTLENGSTVTKAVYVG